MAKKVTTASDAAANATDYEQEGLQDKNADTANLEATEDTEQFIYIGPTLPAGQLKRNTIFAGSRESVEEALKDVIEKFPLVRKMIVPISDLAEKKQRIKTAGTIYNKYYHDIESAAAAPGKEA